MGDFPRLRHLLHTSKDRPSASMAHGEANLVELSSTSDYNERLITNSPTNPRSSTDDSADRVINSVEVPSTSDDHERLPISSTSTRSSTVESAGTALVDDYTHTSGPGPCMRGVLTREISRVSEASAGQDEEDGCSERSWQPRRRSVLAEYTPDSNGPGYNTILAEAAEMLSEAPPAPAPSQASSPALSLPGQDDGDKTLRYSPEERMPKNPARRTISMAVCLFVAFLAIWASGLLATSPVSLSRTPPCSSQNDDLSLDLLNSTSRILRNFSVGHPVPIVDLPFSISSRIHELELAIDSIWRDMLSSLQTCPNHAPSTSLKKNDTSALRELASSTVSLHAQVSDIVIAMAQTMLDITAAHESLSEVSSATEQQKRDLLADLRPSSSWWRTLFARSGGLAAEFKRLSSRRERNEEALRYLESAQGMLDGLKRQWRGLAGVLRTVEGAMDQTGGYDEEDNASAMLQILCEVMKDAADGADVDAVETLKY